MSVIVPPRIASAKVMASRPGAALAAVIASRSDRTPSLASTTSASVVTSKLAWGKLAWGKLAWGALASASGVVPVDSCA